MSNKTNKKNNNDIYVDDSENENVNKLVEDMLDDKKPQKKVVGLYLDPDVNEALRKIGEQGGRGAKSKIANDVLRAFFKERGIL